MILNVELDFVTTIGTSVMDNITVTSITLAILIILGAYIIWKMIELPKSNPNYVRQLDEKTPIAILKYYYDENLNKDFLWIAFLELVDKKIYKLDRISDNGKTDYIIYENKRKEEIAQLELLDYEKKLVDWISIAIIDLGNRKEHTITYSNLINYLTFHLKSESWTQTFYRLFKKELKHYKGVILKESNYLIVNFIFLIYYSCFFGFNAIYFTLIAFLYTEILINFKKEHFWKIIITIVLSILMTCGLWNFKEPLLHNIIPIIIACNPILLYIGYQILLIPFFTKEQKEIIMEVQGMVHFLNDFSKLDDKPMEYIYLYDKYFIYAEAFHLNHIEDDFLKLTSDDKN